MYISVSTYLYAIFSPWLELHLTRSRVDDICIRGMYISVSTYLYAIFSPWLELHLTRSRVDGVSDYGGNKNLI